MRNSPAGGNADPRADEDLVREAIADRDGPAGRAAANELLERYQGRIYQWCHRYVRERERALDLTQDVMAKIWTSLPSFGFRSKFSWWVFVVTRNRCLNAVKSASLWADGDVPPDSLPAADDPAAEFERNQDLEATRRLMIDHLDEQERLALWLSYSERMPVEDITRALNLDNATGARALLQRARRRLRSAVTSRAAGGD